MKFYRYLQTSGRKVFPPEEYSNTIGFVYIYLGGIVRRGNDELIFSKKGVTVKESGNLVKHDDFPMQVNVSLIENAKIVYQNDLVIQRYVTADIAHDQVVYKLKVKPIE
jgi:hypothetical protein